MVEPKTLNTAIYQLLEFEGYTLAQMIFLLFICMTLTKLFMLTTERPDRKNLSDFPIAKNIMIIIFLISTCTIFSHLLILERNSNNSQVVYIALGTAMISWFAYLYVAAAKITKKKQTRFKALLTILIVGFILSMALPKGQMIGAIIQLAVITFAIRIIWVKGKNAFKLLAQATRCMIIGTLTFLIWHTSPIDWFQSVNQWAPLITGICYLGAIWFYLRFEHRIQMQSVYELSASHAIIKQMIDQTQSELDHQLANKLADVTQHQKTLKEKANMAQADLDQTLMELQVANKHKQDFLNKISHELKTPLNGMLGSLNLINKSNLPKEDANYLYSAQLSTDRLLHQISNIINLNELKTGSVKLQREPLAIENLAQSVFNRFLEQAKSKQLDYRLSLPKKPLPIVLADPSRLDQTLTELIDNAFKFTKIGSVSVKISTIEITNSTASIQICVSDTGVGINTNMQDKIFNDFEQIEEFFNRQTEGSGIGLSLCNHLVRLMGGNLTLVSAPDKGSEFTIRLGFPISKKQPLKEALLHQPKEVAEKEVAEKEGVGASSSPATNLFDGKHILVVEDNTVNHIILIGILKKMGITTDLAKNGKEAVDLFEENKYNAILMDCQMPVMNGFDATREIRKLESGHIPIIAVSANSTSEDVEKCLSSGMDGHVAKPVTPTIIGDALKKYMLTSEYSLRQDDNK